MQYILPQPLFRFVWPLPLLSQRVHSPIRRQHKKYDIKYLNLRKNQVLGSLWGDEIPDCAQTLRQVAAYAAHQQPVECQHL